MRRISHFLVSAIALLVTGTGLCQAVSITLAPTPTDLTALQVGDTITIDVVLGELAAGDELEFLGVTIGFDSPPLGTATNFTAGAIIPDPSGFVGFDAPGVADGSFDAFFTMSGTDRITSNGIFFSFDIPAVSTGSGEIGVDFADALRPDFTSPGVTTSAPLPFTVIPLPSMAIPGIAMILCVVGGQVLRHRRA